MGRPRTPLLSADRIADAALELVNTTGGFTMPALAARLGVRPSSLYNHVAGRDAIVELLRERAMSEVELPSVDPDEPPRPWRNATRFNRMWCPCKPSRPRPTRGARKRRCSPGSKPFTPLGP